MKKLRLKGTADGVTCDVDVYLDKEIGALNLEVVGGGSDLWAASQHPKLTQMCIEAGAVC